MREYKKWVLGIFGILLLLVSALAFLTYNHSVSTSNWFLKIAIEHHLIIMIFLVLVSIGFGFFWSLFLYKEIEQKQQQSESIMDVVMLFLGSDERKILDFLVKEGGRTTQSEIARLNNMGKVKAYRSVQKMQEKQLIDIVPHGKVRQIILKDKILHTLLEK